MFALMALFVAVLIDLVVVNVDLAFIQLEPSTNRLEAERSRFDRFFHTARPLVDLRGLVDVSRQVLGKRKRPFEHTKYVKNPALRRLLDEFRPLVRSVGSTLEVFVMRCVHLVATLPITAVVCIVAGVDGYVRREVRKVSAGYESARIYHFAKRSFKPIFFWTCGVYLTLPVVVDVRWAFGFLTISLPLLVAVTISRFKKYI